jgi:hypothetical protein
LTSSLNSLPNPNQVGPLSRKDLDALAVNDNTVSDMFNQLHDISLVVANAMLHWVHSLTGESIQE